MRDFFLFTSIFLKQYFREVIVKVELEVEQTKETMRRTVNLTFMVKEQIQHRKWTIQEKQWYLHQAIMCKLQFFFCLGYSTQKNHPLQKQSLCLFLNLYHIGLLNCFQNHFCSVCIFYQLTIKLSHLLTEFKISNNFLELWLIYYCGEPSVDIWKWFSEFGVQNLKALSHILILSSIGLLDL